MRIPTPRDAHGTGPTSEEIGSSRHYGLASQFCSFAGGWWLQLPNSGDPVGNFSGAHADQFVC